MAIACLSCGTVQRDGARFCDACGAPLESAGNPAEYKQVTVMFADVVRSMDLAAHVGAERLRELMTELFNRSASIVKRYGGTVDKFTGDGIMAEFGAPIALEDHAARACRAALDIQQDVKRMATEVVRRDNIALQLRVGLNSGQVIAGEIGSGPLAYTTVGEQVGMAQRMETVAPPGGVMVSESTARLVEDRSILGEPELVHIKGEAQPVPARRLLGMATGLRPKRSEPSLIGRQREMDTLAELLEASINGAGRVVGVAGPAGLGKSRIVRELTSLAAAKGVEVFTTHCESHAAEVPFYALAGLVRMIAGVNGIDGASARSQVRQRFPEFDSEDHVLLDELLGIDDGAAPTPQIDPDARRRRLMAMANAVAASGEAPALYVVEDAHWIDDVSESMLAEFLPMVPHSRSSVLITYRPEYAGVLADPSLSQTIALGPLDDAQISELSAELLGADRSVTGLADVVANRAAGNPFFAEEIVRDLTERDVLIGGRGCYLCVDPADEISVPSTLQAVIASRIDRLRVSAKRTLNAAAVIGSRFDAEMLRALAIEPDLDDLVRAELIDYVDHGSRPEYTFQHPLIRAVAYESQLKSDRAQLHRRFAQAIDQNDQNASLIAEHLEAAGDLPTAYAWHMRAGAWAAGRDIAAAQLSWDRARRAADALPAGHPERLTMQIHPRMYVCANGWRRFHPDMSARFEELQQLCEAAGDTASLAVGMAGLTMEHLLAGRIRAASALASKYMAVVESLGDPVLTAELARPACVAKLHAGDIADVHRWAEAMISTTDGSPHLESTLSIALVFRAVARWTVGEPAWQDDMDRAVAVSRTADVVSQATVIAYKYTAIARGIVLADDTALAEIEDAIRMADRSSDETALILIRTAQGIVLVHHGAERLRGYRILAGLRDTCMRECYALNTVPILQVYGARECVDRGDIDDGIEQLRSVCDRMVDAGNIGNLDVAVVALVEALLARGTVSDIADAEQALGLLDAGQDGTVWASRAVTALRLRALIARARGDEPTYRSLEDEHRQWSTELGFRGHLAWSRTLRD